MGRIGPSAALSGGGDWVEGDKICAAACSMSTIAARRRLSESVYGSASMSAARWRARHADARAKRDRDAKERNRSRKSEVSATQAAVDAGVDLTLELLAQGEDVDMYDSSFSQSQAQERAGGPSLRGSGTSAAKISVYIKSEEIVEAEAVEAEARQRRLNAYVFEPNGVTYYRRIHLGVKVDWDAFLIDALAGAPSGLEGAETRSAGDDALRELSRSLASTT